MYNQNKFLNFYILKHIIKLGFLQHFSRHTHSIFVPKACSTDMFQPYHGTATMMQVMFSAVKRYIFMDVN